MDTLSDIEVFVCVVATASFTRAADKLGIAKSAASKSVGRLEAQLGVRLLNRTTRRLSLTEAGAAFYARTSRALVEIEAARLDAQHHQAVPSGTLRVAAPMSFGITMVAPLLPAFMRQYPKVSVDLMLDDRQHDIVADGIDVAIRISQLADSSLVARRLAPIRHVLVASPDYLERRGLPATPRALREHDCLIYTLRASPHAWTFIAPDGSESLVPVHGTFHANNGLALREASLAGHGIALMTSFSVGEDVRCGRLVRVLPEYSVPPLSAYAVYHQRRHGAAKLNAFVDFLVANFGDAPHWDRGLA